VLKEIKRQVENEILYYKMITNPEIRKDSFMRKYPGGTTLIESPYNIIFDPPFRNTNYKMIMGIERWGIGNYAFRNFYLITKKGNRFTNNDFTYVRIGNNMRNWPELSPFSDTLLYDLWSKSFPFDTRFIVYFNSTNNKLYPIGGDMELYPVNWNEWLPDMDIRQIISLIAEIRLDKFGILKRKNELTGIQPLASSSEFWNDGATLDSINAVSEENMSKVNYDFYGYVPEGLRISNGFPVLVRVPINNNYLSGEVEFTYYQPEINIQDCSVHWKEIK
jgi:hypothetical protein